MKLGFKSTYASGQVQEGIVFVEHLHHGGKAAIADQFAHTRLIGRWVHDQVADQQTHVAGDHCVLHVGAGILDHCNKYQIRFDLN